MDPQTNTSEGTRGKGFLLFAILIIILIAIAYLAMKGSNRLGEGVRENVEIESVNLASATTGQEKIPPGFPPFIKVETMDVYVSYRANFIDRSVMQYAISYTTDVPRAQKYREYLDLMTRNGFTFPDGGQNETTGTLQATKDNDDLIVVVSDKDNKTSVQITYIDRQ